MSRRGSLDGQVIVAWVTIVAVFGTLIGSIIWGVAWTWGPTAERTGCTITNLETSSKRSSEGNRGDLKLAYTDGCGVLAVDDNVFRGYIDSGDVYGKLQEGRTYDVTTIGWRWHLPTSYPNVIDATETR